MTKGHRFDPTILREYDIRGVFGETLGVADAYALGRTFAGIAGQQPAGGETARLPPARQGESREADAAAPGGASDHPGFASRTDTGSGVPPRIVVGRDGRLSSPALEEALVDGLADGGADVVRIGLAPTPMLYFAEASLKDVQGGIQVTGSHNPADHNGFKIVLRGRPFFGAAIRQLGALAAQAGWTAGERQLDDFGIRQGRGRGGVKRIRAVEQRDVIDAYVERLLLGLAGIAADHLAGLRMAWDAGNGAAGPVLEKLIRRLPGEHHLLFSEVDGRFPNHHPDPTIDANLSDLRAIVAAKNLHFGVAFDGDADRIGVVDSRGRAIPGDQLLAIYAQDVLAMAPDAAVVCDVKASRTVVERIATLGGRPVMAASGHSLIKTKMKETDARLGGETSGHLFFADDYYGYDDGVYAAVRLIAATHRLRASIDSLFDALPRSFVTPELRFAVAEDRKFVAVEEVRRRLEADGAQVIALDGVRVAVPDGWWLLRASNTQAALTARAESETPEGLARLIAQIDRQLALSGLSRG